MRSARNWPSPDIRPLGALPGISHDLVDEDGSVWLRLECLKRGTPPAPPEEAVEWLEVSPDPDLPPTLKDHLIRTVSEDQRAALAKARAVRREDCTESTLTTAAGLPQWDVRLRLEDRPEIAGAARDWIETVWLPWAVAERPVRKTLMHYQRFFEVAQLAEMGGGDMAFELVWGISLSRWKFDGNEIDVPLIERLVEIDLDETDGAPSRFAPEVRVPW